MGLLLYILLIYLHCLTKIINKKKYINKFQPNTHTHTGFGLCAVAESNKGTVMCAESMSRTPGQEVATPEEIGKEAASRLLEEIYRGGCVDAIAQPLLLTFMALAPADVSKAVLGPLTPYT